MLKLYSFTPSGNCYKVRLLLNQLGIDYEQIEVNLLRGDTRTPEFRQKSPAGKLPVLETETGAVLLESNAMLCYLAEGTEFFPPGSAESKCWLRARVMQWLFFEQFSLAPNLGPARFWTTILGQPEKFAAAIAQKQEASHTALVVLDKHLASQEFAVGERYTIADIALFAYTHVAPEGGISLESYPHICRWLAQVRQRPGFIPLAVVDKNAD